MQHLWKISLPLDVRDQIWSLAQALAERLSQEEMVSAITRKQAGRYWQDTSLAAGFPCLALLFSFLTRLTQEERVREAAYAYLHKAVKATQIHPLEEAGLSKGTGGLAIVLSCFPQDDKDERIRQASATLARQLAWQAMQTDWVRNLGGREVLDYDAIRGVAGVLRALVICGQETESEMTNAIGHLLQILVAFASTPDAWFIPSSFFPTGAARYPGQLLINCGLAHGLPGPLAALALASLAGYTIDGQAEALEQLANWLADRYVQTPWGIDWPDFLVAQTPLERVRRLPPARAGWCYGAPGVVRALWLAGQALDNAPLRERAVDGMRSILRRPPEMRRIDPLTLCHGEAGLLIVALRFLHDTADPLIADQIPAFVRRILGEYRPETPLGFQYDFRVGSPIDSFGFFTGVTGTLLALLAASSSIEPTWDRALLLS